MNHLQVFADTFGMGPQGDRALAERAGLGLSV